MKLIKTVTALMLTAAILGACQNSELDPVSETTGESVAATTEITTTFATTTFATETTTPVPEETTASATVSTEVAETAGASCDFITIKGVKYGVDLTRIDLSGLGLADSDIEPLKYMVNLEWLNLNGNQIGDLSPLSGLINLKRLELDDNQISDLSPLGELVNVQYLALENNKIDDISPLYGLVNLTQVYCNNSAGGNNVDYRQENELIDILGRAVFGEYCEG